MHELNCTSRYEPADVLKQRFIVEVLLETGRHTKHVFLTIINVN